MRRTAARLLLVASTLTSTSVASLRAEELNDDAALLDQAALPSALDNHGARPKADPSVLPPAATTLPDDLAPLKAPPALALPVKPSEVKVRELRPLTLEQAERLTEVNNPSLKAAASQVEQAKSQLLSLIHI